LKRPTIISIICYLGFLSIVFTFPAVFSPSVKKLGDFVPALYGFLVAGSFISYIGLWHMKQWGVQMFLVIFFIKTLFFMSINDYSAATIMGIIFSVIFAGILLRFYPKMDLNL
jgi:hypothetical protein